MSEDVERSELRVPHVSFLRRGSLHLERLFWIAGAALLAVCLFAGSQMLLARRAAARIVPQSATGSAASSSFVPTPSNENAFASGSPAVASGSPVVGSGSPVVVGRVEIPALGLSTPLLAGDDSMSLTQGAGHIPGTAYPGGLGTVGIAGHRDTHFRRLSQVAKGMDVRLIDHSGTWHYRVASTEIVTPDQVDVLDILSKPGLALVTCYPFSYVGHAPKRFVVHATLVSAAPDEPSAQR